MKRLPTLLASFTGGYLLMYFSEFMFYGQRSEPGLPQPPLTDLVYLLAAYTLMAYLVFSLIQGFQVRSLPALFLVGAVYGWVLEGVVVTTVYESVPFSISFTALAWHAPLDIVLGLYLLPRWLQMGKFIPNLLRIAGLGIFWGIWVLWPWYELRDPIPLADFLLFSTLTSAALIPAYWLLGRLKLSRFQPSKWVWIPLVILLLINFLFNAVPTYPAALLLLPGLLGSSLYGLYRNKTAEKMEETTLSLFSAALPIKHLALLPLLPISAGLTYAVFLNNGWRLPSNVLLGLTASLGGTALFGISLWKTFSGRISTLTAGRSG